MGREITPDERLDESLFRERLRDETKTLMRWFRDAQFDPAEPVCIGLEAEAWLIDHDGFPAPRNSEFLKSVDDPLVVPELSAFNFEINGEPEILSGNAFGRAAAALNETWSRCSERAHAMGLKPLMTGIPATLREDMLSLDTITPSNRYRLLNDRVFEMRDAAPLEIEIEGRDALSLVQDHLMIEAACTSLQIHLMVSADQAARTYNAMQIASAPLLAISANSPYLYGHRLWEETRIAAFEAAIDLPGHREASGRRSNRVTFGSGYLRESMLELFLENMDGYDAILPMVSDTQPERLRHLKLQNGTIWRWNRPVVQDASQGTPHLRIESRVMPAGPTIADMVANMAFCVGLTLALRDEPELEARLRFEAARTNFYACAQKGLDAEISWLDGQSGPVQALILTSLADRAEAALIKAGVDAVDAAHRINIIRSRARNGQNGAVWQRAHANCHGRDFQRLVLDYLDRQERGLPVHQWIT